MTTGWPTAGWPTTEAEAITEQERLRPRVDPHAPAGFAPCTATGLDVHYTDSGLTAAACTIDLSDLRVVEQASCTGAESFPYIPGLFAFRELPLLLAALAKLSHQPEVLVCDGQGLAHPRRFGLACHAGVLTGVPALGVGKNALGAFEPPGPQRGDWTPLVDGDEVVGRALRTRDQVKPVFVSIGHRMDLDTATDLVLTLTPRYRLPETTRQADRLSRSG
ncbi:endonuclease V [Actinokineospora sp. NBRC 105648]|uniref:endonuclease V n=1 Tax=Actinokineospora sp. NBRC 105648 TaxID=3032206 RepID=UPI0024A31F44|nr:endonuclease V [Actinokineospora sp. NBRC 105648]GLZ37490.1 endonuclease V [Actinokineospora sp. NBRC 105648]